ncbi:MAG: amino acid-binding protein [Eggerthellaceae bacterium]
MAIKQISVFVQSKPGHLKHNLDLLQTAGISVRGFSCSDTGDYGIARFIVDDPEQGCAVLKDNGAAVTLSDVICLELIDKPGELARVFGLLSEAGINITYCYSLIATYICFKVDNLEEAERLLSSAGVRLITHSELR